MHGGHRAYGRDGVGPERGSAAVRPWLGAIGARDLPRERPTPWPCGGTARASRPGAAGGGRRVGRGRARSPLAAAGDLAIWAGGVKRTRAGTGTAPTTAPRSGTAARCRGQRALNGAPDGGDTRHVT